MKHSDLESIADTMSFCLSIGDLFALAGMLISRAVRKTTVF